MVKCLDWKYIKCTTLTQKVIRRKTRLINHKIDFKSLGVQFSALRGESWLKISRLKSAVNTLLVYFILMFTPKSGSKSSVSLRLIKSDKKIQIMEKVKQVIICSAGHSGSTMLDMIIGAHPKCESLGELLMLPMEFALNHPCTCGNEIRVCPLWSRVAENLGLDVEGDPYALNLGYIRASIRADPRVMRRAYIWRVKFFMGLNYLRLRYGISFPKMLMHHFNDGIINTMRVFKIVRQLTGKSIVVDSSKQHSRAVSLYLSAPEETRLIMLVRDGRGVFYSQLKLHSGQRQGLIAWKSYYSHLLPLLERYVPEQHVMRLRYEDLVMYPELECRRICDFLGITFYPKMIDFTSVIHHNVNGNRMRRSKNSELYLDDKWKNELSVADIKYFEQHAGSMNRGFGYKD